MNSIRVLESVKGKETVEGGKKEGKEGRKGERNKKEEDEQKGNGRARVH